MNENLCRAVLRAGLTEEDVATRLQVDPKTVRRWLEGRLPYLRHRWALAAMLGADETDLWPVLRGAPSRPPGVEAIFPRRDAVPSEVWLRLLGSARREIDILDDTALFLAAGQGLRPTLLDRIRIGVRLRICLAAEFSGAQGSASKAVYCASLFPLREALALTDSLPGNVSVEVRLHRTALYNTLYRADNHLLATQHVYGASPNAGPTVLLRQTDDGMFKAYRDSFESIWSSTCGG